MNLVLAAVFTALLKFLLSTMGSAFSIGSGGPGELEKTVAGHVSGSAGLSIPQERAEDGQLRQRLGAAAEGRGD